jgi:hypothetical protein
MIEWFHDYLHDEHSLPLIRLMFVLFLDEWLRMLLDLFAQLVLLHFDMVKWLLPYVLHPKLMHSHVHSP